MSHTLSRPSPFRRSGLLSLVVGLHIGVLLLLLAAKTVAPQIMEIPLVVDLLQPEAQQAPEAKPLPMAKPTPVKAPPTPAPKAAAPQIEATQSSVPSPAAPVAPPVEAKPTPPAPEPVSQARFDADYLRNPAPPYPPLARRMGEEGLVLLRVLVNAQGTADSVEIKTSSGSERLDDSAQRTVRNWKFIPAKRGDAPVQSWVLVPIIFKLEH